MAIGTLAAIAGLASLAGKGAEYAVKKNQAAKQNQLAADTQRYSPWTGLQAQAVEQPNLASSLLEGAAGGVGLAQGVNKLNFGGGGEAPEFSADRAENGAPSLGNYASKLGGGDGGYGAGMGNGWQDLSQQMGMGKPTLFGKQFASAGR